MRVKNVTIEQLEKHRTSLKDAIALLEKSRYFNKDWYLENNPDIKEQGFDPILHFLVVGWREGRDPSKYFNTILYLDNYRDVYELDINPLVHYELIGKKEKKLIPRANYIDNSKYIYYLSLVVIIKNEALYIKEWLDYHISMGVEHFYIYDNESTDNVYDILKFYIDEKYVTYTFWSGEVQQVPAYNNCLKLYGHTTRWLAIIDLDEFICPQKKISIPKFLQNYEDYHALAISWVLFDSNKHVERADGSVLRNYTRVHYKACVGPSKSGFVKCIINPSKALKLYIHTHFFANGRGAVTENYEEIWHDQLNSISVKTIRLNHYYSKSKEEYYAKVRRGRAAATNKYKIQESQYNFPFTTYDCTIWKHIKKKDFKMRLDFLKYEFFRILYKYIKPRQNKSME